MCIPSAKRHSRGKSSFKSRCLGLSILVYGCLIVAAAGSSQLDVSSDEKHVAYNVEEMSRREAIARLLAEKDVETAWNNSATADERITGRFAGTFDSVARDLLASTNFVIVYGRTSGTLQISRIVVYGSSVDTSSPIPPATERRRRVGRN